jgi:hypothetical protein
LAVIELDWGVAPGNVELFARLGHALRGAEVAAGIERVLLSRVDGGAVAVRRDATRVTYLFRAEGFVTQHDFRRSPIRSDEIEMSNASVRIHCRTHGTAVRIGDGWNVDFLTTKRADLAPLAENPCRLRSVGGGRAQRRRERVVDFGIGGVPARRIRGIQ